MEQRDDGGPAFPVSTKGYPDGMSLRDYFMAHAPVVPQSWFHPVMPVLPEYPAYTTIEDAGVRADVKIALDTDGDAETKGGREWLEGLATAREATAEWRREEFKQLYVQWPAAWADAMLKARQS